MSVFVWAWVALVIVGPRVSDMVGEIVLGVAFLRVPHMFFSGLGFFVIMPLFIYSIMLYVAMRLRPDAFPGGWNYKAEWSMPNPCQVVERRLLPDGVKEEYVFLTWVAGIFLIKVWVPQVVGGVISLFIIGL